MTTADIDLQQLAEQAARMEGSWIGQKPPTLEERFKDRLLFLLKFRDAPLNYTDAGWVVYDPIDYQHHMHPNPAVAVTLAE